ncbi:MAG: 2-amino-4-hydroxy-6-hydroxymethyldihydropteridine diphosphokinase [Gammaproteobacteria bacterium]|nr:2-amino-4-hydroxy-6-hydroxymethyldihydropteridine diphosphokinase [Gammaproteobacteria bacterium]
MRFREAPASVSSLSPGGEIACVGIGSNLDGPENQVRKALLELAAMPRCELLAVSNLYRSAPLGGLEQPWYVNAAAVLQTRLTPLALLSALFEIENQHGRQRHGQRWASRTLDLDLLLYGAEHIDQVDLTLPHPGVAERNFVIIPLAEAASRARLDIEIPGLGSVHALAARSPSANLLRIGTGQE